MSTHSTIDNYRILKTLGTGYSGKVKLGQDLSTGNTFALKLLSAPGEPPQTLLETLKHEFNILKNLNHPSIIKMFDLKTGIYKSKSKAPRSITYAVIELATGGEIFDVIFHSKGFDEKLSRYYFKSLVESMVYLHDSKIAHRDLKPENLLLDSQFKLKIVDFGFATLLRSNNAPNKTRLGTEKYMAPELLYHKAYDARKVDVFAAGVILFVFYSGHPPFNQATENDPYYRAFIKNNDKFWDFHSKQNQKRTYSSEFKALINSMLSFDSTKRCTFHDISSDSAWLKLETDEAESIKKIATYMSQMHEIKQQEIANTTQNGGVRGDLEENELNDLHGLILPNLKYEDLIGVNLPRSEQTGMIIKSSNKQLLAALLLKKAIELGCKKEENKNEKLILKSENENEGNVVLEVKFYQHQNDEFEILFTRKLGDYFEFQKIKTAIYEAVQNSCERLENNL